MVERVLRGIIGRVVPPSLRTRLRLRRAYAQMDNGTYERLYEAQARAMRGDDAVGDGDFDQIRRFELEALRGAGVRAHHTLLDFGWGVGHLAVHAVPYLSEGVYIGVDISETFLCRAEERIRRLLPGS